MHSLFNSSPSTMSIRVARNRTHSYHGYPNFMRDRWTYWHQPREEFFDEDDDFDMDTDELRHREELDAATRYESWVADTIASFEEEQKRFEEEEELLEDNIVEEERNDELRALWSTHENDHIYIPGDDDEELTSALAMDYVIDEEGRQFREERGLIDDNLYEEEANDTNSANAIVYDGHIPDDDEEEITANLVRDYYENSVPESVEPEESDADESVHVYDGHIPDDDEEELVSELIEAYQDDQWRLENAAHYNIPVENLMGEFVEEYDRDLFSTRRELFLARGENRFLKNALDNVKRALSNSRRTCSRYRAERDNARNALTQTQVSLTAAHLSRQQMRIERDAARENASSLESECQRLQNEKDGAIYRIDELCNDELISSKDLHDLDSMEKKMKLVLDRIAKRKETLVQSLSEEAEKRLCVICQEEAKTVLLL